MTPLPKRAFRFWTPLVRYVFHTPRVSVLCFSCTRIHERADQKLFWRGPKIFGRARSLVRFPPPIHFAPPPYHGPILSNRLYFLKQVAITKSPAVAIDLLRLKCPFLAFVAGFLCDCAMQLQNTSLAIAIAWLGKAWPPRIGNGPLGQEDTEIEKIL